LIPKYARNSESVENTIVELYKLGITGSDITKIVNDIYGKQYSKSTVSRISSSISANVEAFKKRPLQEEYAVVYLDGTMMSLKRDTVAKECVYIALGITPEGNKEILAYSIAPTESVTNWKEILKDLQDRGVKRVSLFCTDGLHGMKEAIEETFNGSKIQRCLLHVQRNINSKVRVKDRTEISEDFKAVYTSKTKDEAIEVLTKFCKKWNKKYPKVTESISENENLLTFYEYPESVRSSIYTTNMIESYNKQLKRKFKLKEQFPNEDSMERYLVCQFEEYNSKFMNRVHKGFSQTSRTDWFED
jgi:Transposase and inactivated derivatives